MTSGIALEFLCFLLIGALGAYAIASTGSTVAAILVVLLPGAAVLIPGTFPGILRSLIRIARSLHWWNLLWLTVFVSGLIFRDRTVGSIQTDPVDAWALFRIALMCITFGVLFFRLVLRQTSWLPYLYRGVLLPLACYCLICVVSTLWSVYPAWTLYKSVEYSVDVILLAAIIATVRSPVEYKLLLDWTWMLEGLLLGSVWVNLLIRPQEALTPIGGLLGFQLSGVMPVVDPNSVGELGAVIGVVACSRLISRHRRRSDCVKYSFALMIALCTLFLAQARSAILGFALGIIVILFASGRVATGVSLIGTGTLLMLANAVKSKFSDFIRRGETEDELHSLSSRVDWWKFAWPRIVDHPFVGYGAYAGGRFFVMVEFGVDTGIHSDWVEVVVGTGLGGLLFAILALVATLWQLMASLINGWTTSLERELTIEVLSVLSVMSVRSIFSPALFAHPPLVFLAILGYAELSRTTRIWRQSRLSSERHALTRRHQLSYSAS